MTQAEQVELSMLSREAIRALYTAHQESCRRCGRTTCARARMLQRIYWGPMLPQRWNHRVPRP